MWQEQLKACEPEVRFSQDPPFSCGFPMPALAGFVSGLSKSLVIVNKSANVSGRAKLVCYIYLNSFHLLALLCSYEIAPLRGWEFGGGNGSN